MGKSMKFAILHNMDTITTAHILVFDKDKVLLVRHGESAGHLTGVYGIPGGHLAEGESLKEAAIREFHEETGLLVDSSDVEEFPRNVYEADIKRKDGTTKHYAMTVFAGVLFAGELRATGETIPEWISTNRLSEYHLLPNVKEAVKAAEDFFNEAYAE